MKKVTIILTGVILMALNAINVNAQNTATVSDANASATIITKITLAKDAEMSFGEIVANTEATIVTLGLNGNLSIETGENKATLFPGTTGIAATFDVTGEAGRNYGITLPNDGDVVLSGPSGSIPMVVSSFITSTLSGNTLDGSGLGTFAVGAQLTVGAGQLAGDYTGTYEVTVTYE
jgi:hypothetical protein